MNTSLLFSQWAGMAQVWRMIRCARDVEVVEIGVEYTPR